MRNNIKPIEANRFTQFVRPGDSEGVEILERWKMWFDETGTTAILIETHHGKAVYIDQSRFEKCWCGRLKEDGFKICNYCGYKMIKEIKPKF